jgi:MFS family permease
MTTNHVSVKSYALVTLAYWVFTLTDGGLRMLVLVHFHQLGYTPLQLASLFLLYELLGTVTNLFGGLIAARIGLKVTLVLGQLLQATAILMLSLLDAQWDVALQVSYVLVSQGISGVAKDLTKVSAKSALKFVLPDGASGRLFHWVALLTGSKNALKGIGFFLGGVLLQAYGFQASLWVMLALVAVSVPIVQFSLPGNLGRPDAKMKVKQLLSRNKAVNLVAAARLFLFGSRDVWFAVALPVYFYEVVGWSFAQVGTFMALWVIGYGIVQTFAPRLLPSGAQADDAKSALYWVAGLTLVPLATAATLDSSLLAPETVVVIGLAVFGAAFAVNSSLHSYLILAYSERDKAAANVGFYYMANAGGRLVGTILSGWVYEAHGFAACLLTASGLLALASVCSLRLPPALRTVGPALP